MNKLSKEELLEEFKQMEVDEEEIRKGVLEVPGVNVEKMNQIHKKRKQALHQIRELTQKPEVNEEWIEEKATSFVKELAERGGAVSMNFVQDFIRSLVEEIK